MTEKDSNKIYVGDTGHSCACCSSSYPTFIYMEKGKIKQEQILAENTSSDVLIKKITMITTIDEEDRNYLDYKKILGVQK